MLSVRTIVLALEYHLFNKERALLRGLIPASQRTAIRRYVRARYLLWDARPYQRWIAQRVQARGERTAPIEPGLLSVITAVWDGTPLRYFRKLAEGIIAQNPEGAAQWVIVNNGCKNPAILSYLGTLRAKAWVAVHDSPKNEGIIGGLRLGLEFATARYVLPVDADDLLYPDCLSLISDFLRKSGYPALGYTDEDKVIGGRAVHAYLKPAFDPVLLANSAYIAHLGVIDRKLALTLGAYTDRGVEGSPDWDLFLRFWAAGLSAAHLPEVVYQWRMHPESTADDAGSKPYIHSSQKAVLQRYLNSGGFADRFEVEYSPLLPGSADFWLRRRPTGGWPALLISVSGEGEPAQHIAPDYETYQEAKISGAEPARELLPLIERRLASENSIVCLVGDDLTTDRRDWIWEALGLFERYPDAVMIGGTIRNHEDAVVSAGLVLGFGKTGAGCPDTGRPYIDPGYFTQLRKQRSVSAVSSRFTVFRAGFLRELISTLPAVASSGFLGAWAGAYALQKGRRVIYSPFLSAVTSLSGETPPAAEEIDAFLKASSGLLPDRRYYPAAFGLHPSYANWGEAYRFVIS